MTAVLSSVPPAHVGSARVESARTDSARAARAAADAHGRTAARAVADSSARPIDRPAAYEQLATAYDRRTTAYQSVRDKIVSALPLRPGDRVLDVGCGTGLCFTTLEDGVGPTGEVIGIDESPAMTTLAGERSAKNGWDNVTLVAASAETATIEGAADAALICTAHDVLQSTDALQNVVDQLRPGAWVVAGGGKFAAPWMVGLNLWVAENHRPYVRSFAGFDKPWRHLEGFVDELVVEELAFGTAYRAIGRVRA